MSAVTVGADRFDLATEKGRRDAAIRESHAAGGRSRGQLAARVGVTESVVVQALRRH